MCGRRRAAAAGAGARLHRNGSYHVVEHTSGSSSLFFRRLNLSSLLASLPACPCSYFAYFAFNGHHGNSYVQFTRVKYTYSITTKTCGSAVTEFRSPSVSPFCMLLLQSAWQHLSSCLEQGENVLVHRCRNGRVVTAVR